MMVDEAAKMDLETAVEIVARWYRTTTKEFRKSFRVRWYNTSYGRREYRRLKGSYPDVVQESDCYGRVEEVEGVHFVFIHDSVWQSGHDMVATAIHELLHIVEPSFSEKQIRELETEICKVENIDRSWILD